MYYLCVCFNVISYLFILICYFSILKTDFLDKYVEHLKCFVSFDEDHIPFSRNCHDDFNISVPKASVSQRYSKKQQ